MLPLALPTLAMNAAMASMTAGMILTFGFLLSSLFHYLSFPIDLSMKTLVAGIAVLVSPSLRVFSPSQPP